MRIWWGIRKKRTIVLGKKRVSVWSTVRKEEKLDIFRPNEMIQRKPEKKSLEQHKVDLPGKEDKKVCDGNDPERQQMLKIGALFTWEKNADSTKTLEKPLENKSEGDREWGHLKPDERGGFLLIERLSQKVGLVLACHCREIRAPRPSGIFCSTNRHREGSRRPGNVYRTKELPWVKGQSKQDICQVYELPQASIVP